MRLLFYGLATAFICSSLPASADIILPEVAAARERLQATPSTYDRVDNFCIGKKPQASCTIPGSTFSGGGVGTCENTVTQNGSTIDMSCVRNGEVWIDRKLPVGGYISDPYLCKIGEDKESGQKWDCKPIVPTPSDQFCKGKNIGSRCIVVLRYLNKNEQHEGTCKQLTETENFYYQGHRTETRQVIRCEPPQAAMRTYTPVHWQQKLFP